MKFINKLVLSLILLSLISCSKNKEEISTIKEQGQELEMVSAYREGMKALNANDTFYAAKKFLEAELLFPQSSWAAKSALMAAYAYYMQDYYSEAQFNLERYLTTYPLDKNRGLDTSTVPNLAERELSLHAADMEDICRHPI